ncbi:MAG: TIM barrel protein [Candidatus Aenigmarchaeota archaeon]|nr:TIM barrel protein [Candidatus Aenigmarchaeota archaeon]
MKPVINLGPAGSPTGNTLDGIAKVKELELQSMEVQFTHGIAMGIELAKQIGETAKAHGIELSVHAPYYINLASEEKEKIKASKLRILESCRRGHYFGTRRPAKIIFHPAYFGKRSKEEAFAMAKQEIEDMQDIIKKNNWNTILCPETTGKHSALGSLDEIIALAKDTKCSMCIDLAHLYARNNGKIDYDDVLGKAMTAKHIKHMHFHFSGINYSAKGELNHLVLDHNPDFKPFAQLLLKKKQDCTIISESPITWKDSLNMKRIFENLGHKF